MRTLPVFEPFLTGREGEFIQKTLNETNIGGTSPTVTEFEREFARRFQAEHAVAVANGTAALHVATMALGLKPGDEVLVPSFTIISNAIAITLCGATPVFVDISPEDWCLNPGLLEESLTSRTVGVMAVHMYGNACDMDFLSAFCQKHKLWLIEDAAQAQQATWNGKMLGTFGDIATYSFYPNKLITTGEGGALLCKTRELAEKAKVLRNLSFNPKPQERFIHVALSNNYRLSGIQAAMGLAQLADLERLMAERERVSALYRELGQDLRYRWSRPRAQCRPTFWMAAIELTAAVKLSVDELAQRLAKLGIETRRFFYPLHQQPTLQAYVKQSPPLPYSQTAYERGLYLPSSSHLTRDEVSYVIDSLNNCLN